MSDRDDNSNVRDQSERSRETDNTGNLKNGYGDGGATPFGQLTQGGSNRAEGGFGGDSVGGYGQQGINSQSGQGGRAPLTQGAGYGQGGSQFGPAGRDSQSGQAPYGVNPDHRGEPGREPRNVSDRPGASNAGYYGRGEGTYAQEDFSPAAQRSRLHQDQLYTGPGADTHAPQTSAGAAHPNDHEPHYRQWRDTQLASHDRDYARWRDEQVRKYDEDYQGWRGERHTAFSNAFEGWRANRGGQSTGSVREADASSRPNVNAAHGANPTLAEIADGHAGDGHQSHHPHKDDKAT